MRKQRRFVPAVAFLTAMFMAAAGRASGQPLSTAFTYQGELRSAGVPASGTYDLRFRLYSAATGGVQVGTTQCADNIAVTEGKFVLPLDFGAQFAGQQRFLEIDVRADAGLGCAVATGFTTLTTRQALTGAPNALFALNAAIATTATTATTATSATTATTATTAATATNSTQFNGQLPAFYQNATNLSSGTMSDLRLSSNVALLNTPQTFSGAKVFSAGLATNGFTLSTGAAAGNVLTADASGIGTWQVLPPPSGPAGGSLTGTYPNPAIGSGVVGSTNLTLDAASLGRVSGGRMYTDGTFVGIGTTLPIGAASFVVSQDTSIFGGMYVNTSYGAGLPFYGYAQSGIFAAYHYLDGLDGNKWKLINSGVLSLLATTDGDVGIGNSAPAARLHVDGTGNDALLVNNTGLGRGATINARNDTAIWGNTLSGLAGIDGRNAGTFGSGIYGLASSADGNTFGGRFENRSTSGMGVYAQATAGTGPTYAVYAQSSSTSGTGVQGFASAPSGSTFGVYGLNYSPAGQAVYGGAFASSGIVYGVHGYASVQTSGYAVYASGQFGASGTKAFRIDHPDDPANKYLLHYSAESPDVINFYSETVTLDDRGEAVIELPAYFAKINTKPRYQLTAVGAPMPLLHIAEKISEASLTAGAAMEPNEIAPVCSFRIAGGAAGGEVSWEVKAVRNDRWMQQRGAPVETDKQGREKGLYQHPELYNQPAQRSVHHQAEQQAAAAAATAGQIPAR